MYSLVIGRAACIVVAYSYCQCSSLVTATALQDSLSVCLSVCHSAQHAGSQSPHLKLASVLQNRVKVKAQFTLEEATRAQRRSRGIGLLFLQPRLYMGVGGQLCAPGKTRYPLYRRLGGPQGRSGRCGKSGLSGP